jgi:D-threonate/D-erythronate kinase
VLIHLRIFDIMQKLLSDLPCAILADDLTGAADAGLPFATRGYTTNIWLSYGRVVDSADINVYDTASRCDPPEQAAAKVRHLCHSLIDSNCPLIFKKLDSTLLGNLGAEIEAVMEACGYEVALVAPSFPAMGRTIVEGRLHLFDEPSDPPLLLPELLRANGTSAVVHIGFEAVHRSSESLAETISELIALGTRMIAFDSLSQADLKRIVQAADLIDARAMLVGSGALASEIAATMPVANRSKAVSAEPPEPIDPGRVLLIIGSANPTTAKQLNRLIATRPVAMIEPGSMASSQALRDGSHLLLRVKPGINVEYFKLVLEAFTPLLDGELRGMVLSGGDTAEVVAHSLNADGIELFGEIAPGVVWGRLIGGRAAGLPVATKAGGFGSDESLVKAVDFLAKK